MTNTITIKALGENTFDLFDPERKQDAHLRLENGQWILDIFDSTNFDKTKKKPLAWIQSTLVKGNANSPDWNDVFDVLAF